MTVRHAIFDSPVGPLTLVADANALTAIWFESHRHPPEPETLGVRVENDPLFDQTATQLSEYFAGRRAAFELPLAPAGTEFQRRVWAGLLDIPYGSTWSYGELAAHIGTDPATASRAVGAANGRNPISIVIPCHRVIGANGSLVGYGGGIERKRLLLELESNTLPLA